MCSSDLVKPARIISFAVAVVIVAGTAFGVHIMMSRADKAPQTRERKPTEIQLAPAQLGTVSRVLSLTGEITAADRTTLSSAIEGTVTNFSWREGDRISKGDRIADINRQNLAADVTVAEATLALAKARLDDTLAGARPEEIARAKETVRQLEASLAYATAHLERTSSLFSSGSASEDDLEKAKRDCDTLQAQLAAAKIQLAQLEAGPTKTEIAVQQALVNEAEAKLELARTKLAESSVTAPFDCTVLAAFVRNGDYVGARTALIEVADLSTLLVRFSVPERNAASVEKGMKLAVSLDPFPGRKFPATVARAFPEVDTRLRTRTVEAVLDDPNGVLPGMFARVQLIVETVENAVLFQSRAALKGSGGRFMVFTVKDGKAVGVSVVLGIEQGRDVQVLEGLQQGTMVAVVGHDKLRDGMPVRVAGEQQDGMKKPGSGQGMSK